MEGGRGNRGNRKSIPLLLDNEQCFCFNFNSLCVSFDRTSFVQWFALFSFSFLLFYHILTIFAVCSIAHSCGGCCLSLFLFSPFFALPSGTTTVWYTVGTFADKDADYSTWYSQTDRIKVSKEEQKRNATILLLSSVFSVQSLVRDRLGSFRRHTHIVSNIVLHSNWQLASAWPA